MQPLFKKSKLKEHHPRRRTYKIDSDIGAPWFLSIFRAFLKHNSMLVTGFASVETHAEGIPYVRWLVLFYGFQWLLPKTEKEKLTWTLNS